jgi:hypothetical protein
MITSRPTCCNTIRRRRRMHPSPFPGRSPLFLLRMGELQALASDDHAGEESGDEHAA